MTNAYLNGVDAIGGTAASRDLNALLNATPMSAAEGRRLVDLSLALVGEPADERTTELARMLSNMGESIESRWVDPLPEQAADLLRQTVRDALALGDKVVGGRTTLGPRGRVIGAGSAGRKGGQSVEGDVRGWDNALTFPAGSYAYRDGRYWRALRDVTPPFFPILQSGDVPGSSDAWREVTAGEAYGNKNVLGEDDWEAILADAPWEICGDDEDPFEVLGMFDIGQAQIRMNGLPKQLPVSVALPLLRNGQQVIQQAIALADQKNLPGPTVRKEAQAHLQWHADALAKVASKPQAIYAPGADLEHWVMQAFIESNSVEEGAAWVDGAWSRMWDEIGAAIAALPAKVQQAIHDAANYAIETTTGLPIWAWGLILAGGVAVLGYGTYKILRGPAGGAIVGHYLGGR